MSYENLSDEDVFAKSSCDICGEVSDFHGLYICDCGKHWCGSCIDYLSQNRPRLIDHNRSLNDEFIFDSDKNLIQCPMCNPDTASIEI